MNIHLSLYIILGSKIVISLNVAKCKESLYSSIFPVSINTENNRTLVNTSEIKDSINLHKLSQMKTKEKVSKVVCV